MAGCSAEALSLYLFLVTVGDAQGLSYYGEQALESKLGLSVAAIVAARAELIRAGLIAYERPLYQVLALDPPVALPKSDIRRGGDLSSVASVLRLALEGK